MDRAQADDVLLETTQNGKAIDQAMVDHGIVDEAQFYQIIADALGTEVVDLDTVEFTPEILRAIPAGWRACIAPCRSGAEDNTIRVALIDPLDTQTIDDLRFALGPDIQVVLAPTPANRGTPEKALRRRHLQHGGDPQAARRSRRADDPARRRSDGRECRSRSERHADHSLRRSDPVPGDPGPGERHSFRAVRGRVQNPLPRRRRALRNGAAAAPSRAAGYLAR